MRTDRYTYVRWVGGFVELYDRRRDPFQLRNLADASAYVGVRRELDRRTSLLQTCSGRACHRALPRVPTPR